MHEVIANLTGL